MKINNYFIDKYFGGIAKNELMLIGSPSGFGKTTFGNCLVFDMIELGLKPCFMSLENTIGDTLTIRAFLIWKQKTRKWDVKLREWKDLLQDEDIIKSYFEAHELLKKFILIESEKAYPIESLEKDLELAKDQGADIIILDHVDYISSDTDNVAVIGTQVMQTLKKFIESNNIPVIAFSQLVKKMDKKVIIPEYNDFYGSSNKSKMATSILMIQREPNNSNPLEHLFSTLFIVRKDRYGSNINVGERIFFNTKLGKYETKGYKISVSQDGTKIKELENE